MVIYVYTEIKKTASDQNTTYLFEKGEQQKEKSVQLWGGFDPDWK